MLEQPIATSDTEGDAVRMFASFQPLPCGSMLCAVTQTNDATRLTHQSVASVVRPLPDHQYHQTGAASADLDLVGRHRSGG